MSASILADQISARQVPAGHLCAWWLGGSGFVLKNSRGRRIYIDPYLSDAVREMFGPARAFLPPILPEQVEADAVISTHAHEDHLDPHAIPIIARRQPETRFIMPPSAMARAMSWGVRRDRITALRHGESDELDGIRVTAQFARHEWQPPGWEVPDAMGVLVESDGVSFYHTGDTEYDLHLRALKAHRFDVATLCINGVSGNMDAHEAALLAWQLGARVVIPHHHLLWADPPASSAATLDPTLFESTYRKLGGAGQVILPRIGEAMLFSAAGQNAGARD